MLHMLFMVPEWNLEQTYWLSLLDIPKNIRSNPEETSRYLEKVAENKF